MNLNSVVPQMSFLEPPSRCPTEILAEIFPFCISHPVRSIVDGVEAPLQLLRVCRRWKDVALSTQTLWSDIHIIEYEPHAGNHADQGAVDERDPDARLWRFNLFQYAAFKRWLDRSNAAPLSCSFSFGAAASVAPANRALHSQYPHALMG